MEFNISENMRNVEITLGIQEFMLHPRIHASKCEVAITIKLAKKKKKTLSQLEGNRCEVQEIWKRGSNKLKEKGTVLFV